MNTSKSNDKKILKVALSGAAGQLAYSLIPMILDGTVFGLSTKIDLRLLDIEPMTEKLNGVGMEIEDCLSPVLDSLICTHSHQKALSDADYAILIGGYPRRKDMDRADLLLKNRSIFVQIGQSLSDFASKNVRVLVVANPANTNALVLLKNSRIPSRNITSLSRLDSNRAVAFLAKKFAVDVSNLGDVCVWGNHSKTQIPHWINSDSRMSLELQREFNIAIQQRGAAVINARGLSSAMSAANAVKDHLRTWHQTDFSSSENRLTSMGVFSKGNPYGIDNGLFFSFPVRVGPNGWSFIDGVEVDDETKLGLKASEKELVEERVMCGC